MHRRAATTTNRLPIAPSTRLDRGADSLTRYLDPIGDASAGRESAGTGVRAGDEIARAVGGSGALP